MATDAEIQESFQNLQTAVDEWATKEILRLKDQADFLKSIKSNTTKISSETVSTSSTLATQDANDFIKT